MDYFEIFNKLEKEVDMFLYVFVVVIVIRIIGVVLKNFGVPKLKFHFKSKTKYITGLFVNNAIDSKVLFVERFYRVPSISVITQIEVTDAYAFILEKLKDEIIDIHQANMFNHDEGTTYFNMTIVEFSNRRMIELGNGYVEVMYTNKNYEWAKAFILKLAEFKIETNMVHVKTPTVLGFARAMEMN